MANSAFQIPATPNPLPVANGGSGATTLASNGVLYGNGTSAVQALAVNSASDKKFLCQVSSGAPTWEQIGKYVESKSTGTVSITTGSWAGIDSLELTAGDWLVSAMAVIDNNTNCRGFSLGISADSGTPTDLVYGDNATYVRCVANDSVGGCVPSFFVAAGTGKTVYLKAVAFGQDTTTHGHRISAVRIR